MKPAQFYRKIKAPLYVQIELTDVCNLRCEHCYNHWQVHGDKPDSLEMEKIEALVGELDRNQVVQVTITGGEPLAKTKSLYYLLEKLTEVGIKFSLNSNLTRMKGEVAEKLKSLGVDSVLTSVLSFDPSVHDGITGKKGSFNSTMSGIQTALAHGIDVCANMVVTRFNADHVYRTGEFLYGQGVRKFTATKCSPPLGVEIGSDIFNISRQDIVRSLDDLLLLKENFGVSIDVLECYPLCLFPNENKYSAFTSHNCTAGVVSCTIGADGTVRPCSHADTLYGNVFSDGLQACWDKMDEWRSGELIPSTCKQCSHLRQCTAGCRMDAKFHGDIAGMDPHSNPCNSSDLAKLLEKNEEPVSVDAEQRLKVRPDVQYRQENPGCFIYAGKKPKPVLITDDSARLVQELAQLSSFSIREISESKSIDIRQATSFIGQLFQLKIVKHA